MLCSGDLLRQSLLPLRPRTLEDCDKIQLCFGNLPVQVGQFGHHFAQQRTTMITAARVFKVGKRLVWWCQPTGNLTPYRRTRTIALAPLRVSRSHALHLAIQPAIKQRQVLELLPAGQAAGTMPVSLRPASPATPTPPAS